MQRGVITDPDDLTVGAVGLGPPDRHPPLEGSIQLNKPGERAPGDRHPQDARLQIQVLPLQVRQLGDPQAAGHDRRRKKCPVQHQAPLFFVCNLWAAVTARCRGWAP